MYEPKEPIFRSYDADESPKVATYSPVIEPIVPGHTVELSGIVGIDPDTKKLAKGGISAETKCILDEVRAQLEKAELSMQHVMKVEVKLAGRVSRIFSRKLSKDFTAMNAVYNEAFKENTPPPTRYTVGGLQLLHHARVEMVVTAFRPD